MGVSLDGAKILLRRHSGRTRRRVWKTAKVATFLCRCGAVIHTSGGVPHPTELLMIADHDIGEDTWDGAVQTPGLYARMTHVFPCCGCRRLWIFENGMDKEPVSYAREPE
jgi:hypothetical protein